MATRPEYRMLTVEDFLAIDFGVQKAERLSVVQRTGRNGWSDVQHDEPVDLSLPSLDLTLPHAKIFSRA